MPCSKAILHAIKKQFTFPYLLFVNAECFGRRGLINILREAAVLKNDLVRLRDELERCQKRAKQREGVLIQRIQLLTKRLGEVASRGGDASSMVGVAAPVSTTTTTKEVSQATRPRRVKTVSTKASVGSAVEAMWLLRRAISCPEGLLKTSPDVSGPKGIVVSLTVDESGKVDASLSRDISTLN